jgi:hypothetical protein
MEWIMIYVLINSNGKATLSNVIEGKELGWVGIECRHDWETMERAEKIAIDLSETTGKVYLAADDGASCSPRFDVLEAPCVGDPVSYTFNGDSTPCGTITKISASLRRIETSSGKVFYRRGQSGSWLCNKTWFLTAGHITERNPSF